MIWPNGDSTKLRAAAVAWRSAGTQFALTEIQSTAGPMGVIRAQQLPEAGLIESAFADAYASTTAVVGQCHQLAAQLDAYAARIDAVHAAVLDLLARICDPLTGIKEVWEFLTDQDEDEIQRIAHDIAVVVDQFSGEVDALAAEITAVVSHAEAVITAMADHAGKQWDRFLHSNPVGVVIDGTGQQLKGFGEEAFGMAKDSWDLGPLRASIDPFGWYRSWEEMLTGMAPLAGLGGENAPGVVESWKQFGKSLIHWDEWTTNPNEALGKTVFDAATLALPGGPLSKLGSKGRDILAGVRGLKERLEPTTPHLEPPATPPRPGPQPPRIEPPESGHPAPAPRRNRRPCPPTVHCRTAPPNPNRRPSTDRLNRWRRRRRRQASPGYPQPPRPAHMCRMACRNRVNMSRRKHHRRRRCLADLLSSQRPLPRTNPSGRPHQQHPRRRRIPRPEAFTQPNRGLTADH